MARGVLCYAVVPYFTCLTLVDNKLHHKNQSQFSCCCHVIILPFPTVFS